MAEIPEKIQVGPFLYKVELNNAKMLDFNLAQNGIHLGYCDRVRLEIILAPDQVPAKMRESLWHEVKHAVFDVCGLCVHSTINEEEYVRCTGTAELDLLRRNPQLVAFLTEAEDG